MRVLMVSTSYPSDQQDWRGRFVRDLVHALAGRTELELRLWSPPGELPASVSQAASEEESRWLLGLMANGGIAHALRTGGIGAAMTTLRLLRLLRRAYQRNSDVDLVHVNWLHNTLPLLGMTVPAVVSVLGTDFGLLRKTAVTLALRRVLAQRRSIVTPNAGWMRGDLERRLGPSARVRPVPFGVDARWFAVQRAVPARSPRRWLVVLRITKRKIGPLFWWARRLSEGGDELHLLGPNQEQLEIPPWVHYHGSTFPDELSEHWFPSAAGVITLSEHDEGRPQVLLEAMAAGLPVLASRLPAHVDVIRHGETGWLAGTEDEFAQGYQRLCDPGLNQATGTNARRWVRDSIGTWADCAARYVDLYRSILRTA